MKSNLQGNRRGSASVELVFLAPIFLLFMIALCSFFEGFRKAEQQLVRDHVTRMQSLHDQEVKF